MGDIAGAAGTELQRVSRDADRNARQRRGVAIEFRSEVERDAFVGSIKEYFAARRFTNSADAFDTVKAYVLEHAAKR